MRNGPFENNIGSIIEKPVLILAGQFSNMACADMSGSSDHASLSVLRILRSLFFLAMFFPDVEIFRIHPAKILI